MAFSVVAFRSDDTARMEIARRIRQMVFCDEQGVAAADEWDGKDADCEHFLILDGDNAIGTARIRPYTGGTFKVERVAVLKFHRGNGAGTAIMAAIMAGLKGHTVILNAQTTVVEFYRRLGFTGEGGVFEEAGIPHLHMRRQP